MNSRATCEEQGNRGTEEALLGDVLGGLEDAHIARDGFRRDEIVAGDHEDADAGLLAQRDAVAEQRGIQKAVYFNKKADEMNEAGFPKAVDDFIAEL